MGEKIEKRANTFFMSAQETSPLVLLLSRYGVVVTTGTL